MTCRGMVSLKFHEQSFVFSRPSSCGASSLHLTLSSKYTMHTTELDLGPFLGAKKHSLGQDKLLRFDPESQPSRGRNDETIGVWWGVSVSPFWSPTRACGRTPTAPWELHHSLRCAWLNLMEKQVQILQPTFSCSSLLHRETTRRNEVKA